MALPTMKNGARTRDDALISAELTAAEMRARTLEQANELYFAGHNYREVARVFTGLADAAPLLALATVLQTNPSGASGSDERRAGWFKNPI